MFQERYEILKALEKGSGGSVYLANDTKISSMLQAQKWTDSTTLESATSRMSGESGVSRVQGHREASQTLSHVVVKIFVGHNEFNFFQKERDHLNKI